MRINWPEISSKRHGGTVYNEQARDVLSKYFEVNLILCDPKLFKKIKYLRIPESLFYLAWLRDKADIWVRDFYSTVATPFNRTAGKNIVMVHHDDFSGFPLLSRPAFYFLSKIFYRNLKYADAIVTVSDYWQKYFLRIGCKNVFKIYNGFDVNNYEISDEDVEKFKAEKNLSGKPIVYLGNCQKPKGVIEAYEALKKLGVHLVTSGRREANVSALNFNLSRKDYLKLLKASSVVVTMSKFKEGWCRTAHEAMLCKTPVIGSGLGGMEELLAGGKQMICKDFGQLKDAVQSLLATPEKRNIMGENGYNFARNFTREKFEKSWLDLINNIRNNLC